MKKISFLIVMLNSFRYLLTIIRFRNKFRMTLVLCPVLFFIFLHSLWEGTGIGIFAQTPTVQDCMGAIPLCQSSYYTTTSYSGQGNYNEEIGECSGCSYNLNYCPGNCLLAGELNDVWYTFTVQTSGNLCFVITPNNSSDDYDWAVYNLTNYDCSDIYCPNAQNCPPQVSCNFSGDPGPTGPNGQSSLTCQWGNPAETTPFNAVIPVTAGQIFVVNVSNFSSTQSGYTIDFSCSSAQVVDNVGPYLLTILTSPACGQNTVTIQFSENVFCNTVQGSDFIITGPGGPYTVTSAAGVPGTGCAVGATYGRDFILTVNPAFTQGGTYTISLVANSVSDVCNNPTGGQTLQFTVTGVNANVSSVIPTSCGGVCDGAITVSGSGGTAPYTYTITPGGSSQTNSGPVTFSNLCGGTYTITVTDALGTCNATVQATVSSQAPLVVTVDNVVNATCGSACDGAVFISVTGGTPGYSYSWTNTTQTTQDITNLCPNTYDVTVTDAQGCTATASATVSAPGSLIITVDSIVNESCGGNCDGAVYISVTGGTPGYSYSWTNTTQTTQDITNLCPNTYTVTVTDANNCTATQSATVNSGGSMSITIDSVINASCGGLCDGAIYISVTGGTLPYSYTWTNTTQITEDITNLCPNTYNVTVTDGAGCIATAGATILSPGVMNVTIDNVINESCSGACDGAIYITVTGGTPPYSFSWTNTTQTSEDITNLCPTTYTVTVTDANNCTYITSATISTSPSVNIVVDSIHNVLCYGGTDGAIYTSVTGGTFPYSYSWTNTTQTTEDIFNLTPGYYTGIVTDVNGCKDSVTTVISEPVMLEIRDTTNQDVLCYGDSTGWIDISVLGGTWPYTYSWTPTGQTTQDIFNLPAGMYHVTVTDAHGCSVNGTFYIIQPQPIQTSFSYTQEILCAFDTSTASVTVNVIGGLPYHDTITGNPYYLFQWDDPLSQTTQTATGLQGNSTYTVTVTDSVGCQVSNTITINVPPELQLTVTSTILCYNDDNGTATANPSGGTSPYYYQWNDPQNQTTQTAVGLTPGIYTVTVTDENGCTIQGNALVAPEDTLQVITQGTDVSCFGGSDGSATAIAYGGPLPYQYSWNGGPFQTNPDISGLTAGTHYVLVVDADSCQTLASVIINQPPQITDTIIVYPVSCKGGDDGKALAIATGGGTPPYTISWYSVSTNGDTAINLSTGTYFVTITDANNCQYTDSVFVPEPTAITLISDSIINDSCACAVGSIIVNAIGGTPPYTYLWNTIPAQTDSVADHVKEGTYTLIITDANNCAYSFEFNIDNFPCPVEFPTIFTPNDDSKNDFFIVKYLDQYFELGGSELVVFNRWGNEVFRSENYKNNWDGRSQSGIILPDGVYYYLFTLTDGSKHQGCVTIVR